MGNCSNKLSLSATGAPTDEIKLQSAHDIQTTLMLKNNYFQQSSNQTVLRLEHMGKVLTSHHLQNRNFKVALKKIEFLIKREEERNLLFYTLQAEVKLVRELDHPNILKTYGTYSEYKYDFVVMEYSDGGNLF